MFQRTVQSTEHWALNNQQITYLDQFLNVSNMFSVKSPDKTLQIVHWAAWEKPRMARYETDCLEM
jgi:hypothetical protein